MRMDVHTHTVFSDGKASVAEMLGQANGIGMDCVAITDHFDPNDYRPAISGLDDEGLLMHFDTIHRLAGQYPGMAVLCGVETTPLTDGTLVLSSQVRENCDIIITSCHYLSYEGHVVPGDFFNDEYWELFKKTMLAMAAGEGDVLGHCEDYLPIKDFLKGIDTSFWDRRNICRKVVERYCDEPYVHALSLALVHSGKSCELHCATQTPREWVIKCMASHGVTFTVGSDAHSIDTVGQVSWGYEMVAKYDLQFRNMERGRV